MSLLQKRVTSDQGIHGQVAVALQLVSQPSSVYWFTLLSFAVDRSARKPLRTAHRAAARLSGNIVTTPCRRSTCSRVRSRLNQPIELGQQQPMQLLDVTNSPAACQHPAAGQLTGCKREHTTAAPACAAPVPGTAPLHAQTEQALASDEPRPAKRAAAAAAGGSGVGGVAEEDGYQPAPADAAAVVPAGPRRRLSKHNAIKARARYASAAAAAARQAKKAQKDAEGGGGGVDELLMQQEQEQEEVPGAAGGAAQAAAAVPIGPRQRRKPAAQSAYVTEAPAPKPRRSRRKSSLLSKVAAALAAAHAEAAGLPPAAVAAAAAADDERLLSPRLVKLVLGTAEESPNGTVHLKQSIKDAAAAAGVDVLALCRDRSPEGALTAQEQRELEEGLTAQAKLPALQRRFNEVTQQLAAVEEENRIADARFAALSKELQAVQSRQAALQRMRELMASAAEQWP